MVDFNKLRTKKKKSKSIDPIEIFRRLPKPPGVNDLYTSQAEVLKEWFDRRKDQDIVVKLHTGGGKTLVGLLMAQSTLNESGGPVLYLTPTVQLVNQTLEKAEELGIPAVEYKKGESLNDDFVNGSAVMVATYKALFNGQSKFGLRGDAQPQNVGAIILDDAHSAFSVIRESFTLEVSSKSNLSRYQELCGLFRKSFKEIDKLGTFDDVVSGSEYTVLEVPYWAWHEKIDAVREQLRAEADNYPFQWPLLRDKLHLCHALISRGAFTITPVLPLVNLFPSFFDAPRRIYMSATISDDSEIIRTFDADPKLVEKSISSRSLAGISERLILIPDLMPFSLDKKETIGKLAEWTAKNNYGAVILVSSDKSAENWADVGTVATGSNEVEKLVAELQEGKIYGPVVFSNRYDGIDLPGDSCRLLVMYGLPAGTSNYELFRASTLYGGVTITRMLAQRIEQGIGRGARGSGDHCVVILAGPNLAGWISKDANFKFLTSATRAQLELGMEVSKEVENIKDMAATIKRSFDRDRDWIEYHAETLAEMVEVEAADKSRFQLASTERKALDLWHDGYHDNAIGRINRTLDQIKNLDRQSKGWMEQLLARIANHWGNKELSEETQKSAYAHNRNLLRPTSLPPYRPLTVPGSQATAIIEQLNQYRFRRGFLNQFEDVCSNLNSNSSANQFEKSLADLANLIGLTSERHDENGKGPDVLWLLPNQNAFVIEAKSRKKKKNALTKDEHGQLLVASEWFTQNYKNYSHIRVSVHPENKATKAAVAGASHALTYGLIEILISDARSILAKLCESSLPESELTAECERLLKGSNIRHDRLADTYLVRFEEIDN